jgi:hypothetical protein
LDLHIDGRLELESGRPVLIGPNVESHIVVGWTDRREAARAVFDALPLLRRVNKVTEVEVDPKPEREVTEVRAALCAALAHHDVSCNANTAASHGGNMGDSFLAYCKGTKGCSPSSGLLRAFPTARVLGGASPSSACGHDTANPHVTLDSCW